MEAVSPLCLCCSKPVEDISFRSRGQCFRCQKYGALCNSCNSAYGRIQCAECIERSKEEAEKFVEEREREYCKKRAADIEAANERKRAFVAMEIPADPVEAVLHLFKRPSFAFESDVAAVHDLWNRIRALSRDHAAQVVTRLIADKSPFFVRCLYNNADDKYDTLLMYAYFRLNLPFTVKQPRPAHVKFLGIALALAADRAGPSQIPMEDVAAWCGLAM